MMYAEENCDEPVDEIRSLLETVEFWRTDLNEVPFCLPWRSQTLGQSITKEAQRLSWRAD